MLASEDLTPAATLREVDRAIAELRRGQPLVLQGEDGKAVLILAAELVTESGLQKLAQLTAGSSYLALTQRRAIALGLHGEPDRKVFCISVQETSAVGLRALADPLLTTDLKGPESLVDGTGHLDEAAVELTKLAHLLPAAVVAPISGDRRPEDILCVAAQAISNYRVRSAQNLERVSEARVPLFDAENTRIVTFRPRNGGFEHLAIIVGEPDTATPVLVRLHSECLTGDLLGSLRCDCGDQLRGAIQTMAKEGSGVLLYLAQEGRGIGLANKLRAYGLQDRGADTLEANEQLGFDPDERIFLPAATMLRALGIARVRLLTNNPAKVAAMGRLGIEVTERVPLVITANPHNAGYLDTKARRFGHQF